MLYSVTFICYTTAMEKLDIFAKDCPARFPLQVISGKWGLLVILALEK